jgi:rhodanese-related sulfurtransferase
MKNFSFVAMTIVLSIIASFVTAYFVTTLQKPSQEKLISEFYETENAVHVSPHGLRKSIMKNQLDVILVDLRSQEEYEREHVIGAINIPAYKDPETSAYGDVERIVKSFKDLGTEKDIVVYCYSMPCMTGRKIGKMLTEHGIYVKHLGIGWNEWRHFWQSWNHEHEWAVTKVEDFIATGKEPGKFVSDVEYKDACPIGGDLGC